MDVSIEVTLRNTEVYRNSMKDERIKSDFPTENRKEYSVQTDHYLRKTKTNKS